jgi:HEAT repeat protein
MKKAYKIIAAILILVAVVFVLIIPPLISPPLIPGTMAYNEHSAVESLMQIYSSTQTWCCTDADGNGMMDHWTMDVSGLYRFYRANNQTKVAFIPLDLAMADAAPFSPDNDKPFGDYPQIAKWTGVTPTPYRGYWFRAMLADENGVPYNQNPMGANKIPACNYQRLGFVAYPETYGKDGTMTFIVERGMFVWRKDTGGRPVTRWPDRFALATEWEIDDGRWCKIDPPVKKSYPDGVWSVEICTPGGHHDISTPVYDDQLTFTGTEMTSTVFASQGYSPAEYTNVKDGTETKWQALQKNKNGGVAIWRGRASDSNYIFGWLTVFSADGKKDRFYFASIKTGPPVPVTEGKAELDLDELEKELDFSNFEKDYAKGLTYEQKRNVIEKGPLIHIRKLLNDDDWNVRFAAINALVKLGDKESVPEIRKLLTDKLAAIRSCAVGALVDLGDKESIPTRKLLKDGNNSIRAETINSLVKLGDREFIPEIRELLKDNSCVARSVAAGALADLGDKASAPLIRELLNDSQCYCPRLGALTALAELGDREAIPEIIKLLKDKVVSVRAWAAIVLVELGAKDKVPKESIEDIKAVHCRYQSASP